MDMNIRQEIDDIKDGMIKVRNDLEKMKAMREEDSKIIGKEMTDILASIDDLRDIVVWHLENLVKKAQDEALIKHWQLENEIIFDLEILSEIIEQIDNSIKQFESIKEVDEEQLDMFFEQGRINESNGNDILQHLDATAGRETLGFPVNSELVDYVLNLKSLWPLPNVAKQKCSSKEDRTVYTCSLNGEYNVTTREDRSICAIKGSCLLEDGHIIITDQDNVTLKKLNSSYKVIDYCVLPSAPWGVCSTGPKEVAVALPELKLIQFASTESKCSCTRSFQVDLECYFLSFSNGELFMTCGSPFERQGHVRVYSLLGENLRSFIYNELNEPIFIDPYHIAVSRDGSRLYVADEIKGLINIDVRGQQHWTFLDSDLKGTKGVCMGIDDVLFVSGFYSYNILQINDHGMKIGTLLSEETDGIENPYSLCYDHEKNRLIVTFLDSNCIKVFDIIKQQE